MNLPLFFARRYLFAKKSHNVINIISAISAIGMAIGTAALVIILSVYNGFDTLIKDSISELTPDYLVKKAKGKTFLPAGESFDSLYGIEGVESVIPYLSESVFVNYDGRQEVATARGIEDDFAEEVNITRHVVNGSFRLRNNEIPYCAVGVAFARSMGISPSFVTPLELYYPDRDKSVSLVNPAASLRKVKAQASCLFSFSAEQDATLVLLPMDLMRELLGVSEEISALEIRLAPELSPRLKRAAGKEIARRLGPDYKVLDSYRQNEALYKMMRYEKAAIFLILIFIIIIIALNIFGSLSMLIIEKQDDIGTLSSLGAEKRTTREIFILEGWLISLCGMAIGLIAGVGLSFAQQKLGFIKMPGNYIVPSYPVVIEWPDIVLITLGVTVIGYIISRLSVASFFPKQ